MLTLLMSTASVATLFLHKSPNARFVAIKILYASVVCNNLFARFAVIKKVFTTSMKLALFVPKAKGQTKW
jgi:hypothetical protein